MRADRLVAAAYRLAAFGDQVEVLSPLPVRDRLVRTARQILSRYRDVAGLALRRRTGSHE